MNLISTGGSLAAHKSCRKAITMTDVRSSAPLATSRLRFQFAEKGLRGCKVPLVANDTESCGGRRRVQAISEGKKKCGDSD